MKKGQKKLNVVAKKKKFLFIIDNDNRGMRQTYLQKN